MNKVLKLASVLSKETTSSENKSNFISQITSSQIGMLILIILGCAGSAWVGKKLPLMEALLQSPGMGMGTLRLFYVMGAAACLILSFPIIVNLFYMSDDLPELLVMPLTPMQIVTARILNLCPMAFGISLIVTLPVGIAYGMNVGASASFYAAIVLAFLSIPVIMLSFTGIIVILLLTFVGVLKNRDHLRVIGAIFGFLLMLAYFYLTNSGKGPEQLEAAANLLNQLGKFEVIFPLNPVFAKLMNGFSIPAVLIILVVTVGMAGVFWALAEKLYLKGALSIMTTSAGGQKLDNAAISKRSEKKSVVNSLVSRDFKLVRRNPAYLIHGFVYPFAMPIIMGCIFFMSFTKQGSSYDELFELMRAGGVIRYMIAFSAVVFITMMTVPLNVIINSSLSREGSSFMLFRQYPISWKDFISAKQRLAIYLSHASASTYTIIVGLILLLTKMIDLPALLYMIVMHLALMYFVVDYNILHDITHPMLDWQNESAMLKKSNPLITVVFMLSGFLLPIGLILVMIFQYDLLVPVIAGISVLIAAAAVFMNIRLYSVGMKTLSTIQESNH